MVKRNSSIELAKIIAIFLIIISHITMSASQVDNQYISNSYSGYNITLSTNSITVLFLMFFKYFGSIGSVIFIIASAWFLVDNNKLNGKKIYHLLIDVWIVSIIFLIVYICAIRTQLDYKLIIKSIFPTLFMNNWFITCYVLLYIFHDILNLVIEKLNQERFRLLVVSLVFIYGLMATISPKFFCYTDLTAFITIYFFIGYVKKYNIEFINKKKNNAFIFWIGIIGLLIMILLTNFLGLKIHLLHDKVQHWNITGNPFIFMTSFGIFNCFRMKKATYSKTVNYVSGLSLLIYIIHENILFRTYTRPMIWSEFYITVGINAAISVVICAIGLFVVSVVVAALYNALIQKSIYKMCDKAAIFTIEKIKQTKRRKSYD